jgi:hypothetical protein
MPRLALLVVSLAAVAGCKEVNPEYCSGGLHPDDPACKTDSGGGGGPCTSPADCSSKPGFPVCDLNAPGGATCVECVKSAECPAERPVCTNDACGLCTQHADCPESNVCLPSGMCARASDVAYVSGTGADGTQCIKDAPCKRIDDAISKNRMVVKVSGIVRDRGTINGATTLIVADPGAKLQPQQVPPDNGTALDIRGASHVQIYDLEINHANGAGNPGVSVGDTATVELTRVTLSDNSGDGARVTAGHLTCTQCVIRNNGGRGLNVAGGGLTLTRSTVRDNLGGINVNNADFQIVSNVIYHNTGGVTGGIVVQVDGAAVNRIDFNSISRNSTTSGAAGIQCSSGTVFAASYNIVWDNAGPGGQVTIPPSNCSFPASDVGSVVSGTGTNPQYVNIDSGDLHLMPTSPVRRQVASFTDPDGLAARDIDGQPRAAPADFGADQTP